MPIVTSLLPPLPQVLMEEFFTSNFSPYVPSLPQLQCWATTKESWARGLPSFLNVQTGGGKTETGITIGNYAVEHCGVSKVVFTMPTRLQQQDTMIKLHRIFGSKSAVLYGKSNYLCRAPAREFAILRNDKYEPVQPNVEHSVRLVFVETPRGVHDGTGRHWLHLREHSCAKTRRARKCLLLRKMFSQWARRVAGVAANRVAEHFWNVSIKVTANPDGSVDIASALCNTGEKFKIDADALRPQLESLLTDVGLRVTYRACPETIPIQIYDQLWKQATSQNLEPEVRVLRTGLSAYGGDTKDINRCIAHATKCRCGSEHCGQRQAKKRVWKATYVVMTQKLLLCYEDVDLCKVLFGAGDRVLDYGLAIVDDESHTWTMGMFDHMKSRVPPLVETLFDNINPRIKFLHNQGIIGDIRNYIQIPTPENSQLLECATVVDNMRNYVALLTEVCDAFTNDLFAAMHREIEGENFTPIQRKLFRLSQSIHRIDVHEFHKMAHAVRNFRAYIQLFVSTPHTAYVLGRAEREQMSHRVEKATVDADDDDSSLFQASQPPINAKRGAIEWFPSYQALDARLRKHWGFFDYCTCMSGTIVDVDKHQNRIVETYLAFTGWSKVTPLQQQICVCDPPPVQDFRKMRISFGITNKSSTNVQRMQYSGTWAARVKQDQLSIARAAERGSGIVMSTSKKRGREQYDLSSTCAHQGVTHLWYEDDPTTKRFRENHRAGCRSVFHGSKGVMAGTDIKGLHFVAILNQPYMQPVGMFHPCVQQFYERYESATVTSLLEKLQYREMRVLLRQAIGRLMRGPDSDGGDVLLLDARLRSLIPMYRAVYPGCVIDETFAH